MCAPSLRWAYRSVGCHPSPGWMGPVPLPDLVTWDGVCVDRMFLAELAFSDFDYIEFALRRDVEASASRVTRL
jgi:hypothetical protein